MTATVSRRPAPVRAPATAPLRVSSNTALWTIAIGAVAVIGLWWQDTFYVHGFGDWLTNAGRITGLLAGYAVIVLLALMALQFRRYPRNQIFAFDFGGSIRAAALAMGGDWHDLGGDLTG